ncbi:MAG TPA: histidine phosphatase family protein [Verrucomicrobiae bacterium]|nr:histidine phosphatase family protein [Verrucomicrobiae bacterium]
MGQIYLVRHGQASFGAADYDNLSERGVDQSRRLGEWFKTCGVTFNGVVTGGLRRHKQTADACLAALPGSPAVGQWRTDPGFDEYNHVEVLAKHTPKHLDPIAAKDQLKAQDNPRKTFQKMFAQAMDRWMSGRFDSDYVESWPAFRARCVAALRRAVASAGGSQAVAVFTSGGAIAAICQELLEFPNAKAADLNFSIVNSAVTKLLYNAEGRVSLSYLNNFAHLEQSGPGDHITYR